MNNAMVDDSALTVSVVVNTLDRADSLAELLEGFRQLTHPEFEVVVVYGPCTDHTEQVVAQWEGRVKARRCPKANLSMSRNIGIAAAAGDIVAFIDDDGIPEPTWLDELCAAYADPEVGAAGGVVYNHTGHEFQTRFMLSDRHGGTVQYDDPPPGEFCFPGTALYPAMLGCNSSFRRSALVGVGGFDEEFDYFLDETDVCLRLIDAGWVIRGLEGAPVHHKYLPSSIRTATKVVTNNHSVVKNKIYFSMVNAVGFRSWTEMMDANVHFADDRTAEMNRQRLLGNIDDDGLAQGIATVESGWSAGLAAGLRGRRRLLVPAALETTELLPFPTIVASDRLRLVFITRTLPPETPGGVGRYMLDLGCELARRGHEVRIVTSGADHDRVDLEQGVWVHRICKSTDIPIPAHLPPVPEGLWQNAGAVAAEVARINRERPVDLVLSSIWDVEHAGVVASTSLPVLTSYVTSFSVVHATQPETLALDDETAAGFAGLERWANQSGHAFHTLGVHVADAVSRQSGIVLDPAGRFVVPLGSADPLAGRAEPRVLPGGPIGVFFGRFEPRKGIDLVLAALPAAMARNPELRFVLAGQDDLADGSGTTFRAAFEAAHPDLVTAGRVEFVGPVSDEELAGLLASADFAVLPSRFESFGLVFVEAMAARLAVVAIKGSGAEEVVLHGETGFLCTADPDGVTEAILLLADDRELLDRMGQQGRRRFEEHFTITAMADRFLEMFGFVHARRPGSEAWAVDTDELIGLPDGSCGLLLQRGQECSLDVPHGRNTIVLAGSGAPECATAVVGSGHSRVEIAIRGHEFHHVVLPAGLDRVTVAHDMGPPLAVVALITADAEAFDTSG